ncbi:MAG: hypothetical protein RIQ60_2797 [Pseudomonadota bacterium]|jgi:outer membrane protein OmpA-like peptidoglycan-associated protein
MKRSTQKLSAGALLIMFMAVGASSAQQRDTDPSNETATSTVDMGQNLPSAQAIRDGLFPPSEDQCEQLKAAGFKCMGFKPSVRYSLPANAFKLGSAEIPGTLKKQLDVFAEVLKTKRDASKKVRVEGHADASGAAAANVALSQRRAEAVKAYLVDLGADAEMLEAVGMGATLPKVKDNPLSPENRRVEIGRANPPTDH